MREKMDDDLSIVINSIEEDIVLDNIYKAIFVGDEKLIKIINKEIPFINKEIPIPAPGDWFLKKKKYHLDKFVVLSMKKKKYEIDKNIRNKYSHSFKKFLVEKYNWHDACYHVCDKMDIPKSSKNDTSFILEHRLQLFFIIKTINNKKYNKTRSIDIITKAEKSFFDDARRYGYTVDTGNMFGNIKDIYDRLKNIVDHNDFGLTPIIIKMLTGSLPKHFANIFGWNIYQQIMINLIYHFMGIHGVVCGTLGIGMAGNLIAVAGIFPWVMASIMTAKTIYGMGGMAYRYTIPAIVIVHLTRMQLIAERKIPSLTDLENDWFNYKQEEMVKEFMGSAGG